MDMVGDYSDEAPLGIFLEIPFQNKQMNKLTNKVMTTQIIVWIWVVSILSLMGEILSSIRDHESVIIKVVAMVLTVVFAPALAVFQSLLLILR
jgi:hypothetical protein